ncbi:hypothetical protein R75461_07815 [Paraburkholderia nemoris]|nr:hypothetical protein R75461_07815 [Paraburkholderia nemoris]
MEFSQLRYFLAIADYLHFTDAATHLGIAQPPLSKQIPKLEREIGAPLFIRHPRRIESTETGRLFRARGDHEDRIKPAGTAGPVSARGADSR